MKKIIQTILGAIFIILLSIFSGIEFQKFEEHLVYSNVSIIKTFQLFIEFLCGCSIAFSPLIIVLFIMLFNTKK